MKIIAAIGLLLAAIPMARAQTPPLIPPASRSASGQFVIHDRRGEARPARAAFNPSGQTDQPVVDLEPALLAVTCERIKQAVYFELRTPSRWQGKIHITLQRRGDNSEPTLHSERFRDGWNYQLSLPARMERVPLVRTLVQVVLTELANREAAQHPAELPVWLIEGLTQHLLATREAEMILSPPTTTIRGLTVGPRVMEKRDSGPLETARLVLRDRPPLSLEELSWMTWEQVIAPSGARYQCSAQLFVWELMRLNEGREHLRAMISELGRCYNWQTAFLHAFHEHFANQLAVEKWWTLQQVYFAGRDPLQLWTPEESWRRLDQALRTSVAIRGKLTELPVRTDVTLQAVIREWELIRQATTIRARISDLEAVKLRVAPEFIEITETYRRTLANYLQQRERPTPLIRTSNPVRPPNPKQLARDVIRQLDALDAQRAGLRPPPPGTDSKTEPTPGAARIPGTF
jgi:hypothetical protein